MKDNNLTARVTALPRLNNRAPIAVPEQQHDPAAPVERSATTSGQWLRDFHDDHSPLGRVRIVAWTPGEEQDGITTALHDFDPFNI